MDNTDRLIAEMKGNLTVQRVTDAATAKTKIDTENVYLVGYPSFWNSDNPTCPDWDLSSNITATKYLTLDFRKRMNDQISALNTVIADQAFLAKVKYVDVNPRFDGHRFCEPEGGIQSWLIGFLDADDIFTLQNPDGGAASIEYIYASILHPTALGSLAIANAIRKVMDDTLEDLKI